MVRRIALQLLFALVAVFARAEDWPQFRGPSGQGHSTERGVPFEWSETRNVLWKTRVPGSGWSSPVVPGGRVWVTSANQVPGASNRAIDASLRTLAFDVETGRQVVNTEVFRIRHAGIINPKNSRASPTPIVEGDRVYVHFGADGTAALTTAGDIVWRAQFSYDSMHGNGGSPVLYDDLLIVSCDGADTAFVVALDKQTGKVRWKTSRRQPAPFPQTYRFFDDPAFGNAGVFRVTLVRPVELRVNRHAQLFAMPLSHVSSRTEDRVSHTLSGTHGVRQDEEPAGAAGCRTAGAGRRGDRRTRACYNRAPWRSTRGS